MRKDEKEGRKKTERLREYEKDKEMGDKGKIFWEGIKSY